MKKIVFLSLLFFCFRAEAQQLFTNHNNELCIKLYEASDQLGPYLVYMVMEDLDEKDEKILEQWDSLDQKTKSIVTQRWAAEGKRTESVRLPYEMNPVDAPKKLKMPDIRPVQHKATTPKKDVWQGRKFPAD